MTFKQLDKNHPLSTESKPQMKALGKLDKAPGMESFTVDIPEIGPDDVLVKVRKASICGTDIHIYKWDEWAQNTLPVPLVTGHEFVGHVIKVGENVSQFQIGDRVSGEGHLVCGTCVNCREGREHHCKNTQGFGYDTTGCFSEYFRIPASNTILLPDSISDDVAAILDPLGNAVHATLSFDLVGKNVLITGAGPIGIMAASIAKHAGAKNVVITEMNDYRLNLARKLGKAHVVDIRSESLSDIMDKLGVGDGFDVGIEMSGNKHALDQMIDALNHGGNISLLGILPKDAGIDWVKVIFKSITIKGVYGRLMYKTWHQMIAMLESGLDVSDVITHDFLVEQYKEAFEVMNSGNSGKVILTWD